MGDAEQRPVLDLVTCARRTAYRVVAEMLARCLEDGTIRPDELTRVQLLRIEEAMRAAAAGGEG